MTTYFPQVLLHLLLHNYMGLDLRLSNLGVVVGHTYVQAYEFHSSKRVQPDNAF